MKALTICQPYAELIATGDKQIENRKWPTAYRGPLAIHAGKSREWLEAEDAREYPEMAFGAVVAVVQLVDCVRLEELAEPWRSDQHACGPWCWLLADVRRIESIPCKGSLGLWEWAEPPLLSNELAWPRSR